MSFSGAVITRGLGRWNRHRRGLLHRGRRQETHAAAGLRWRRGPGAVPRGAGQGGQGPRFKAYLVN